MFLFAKDKQTTLLYVLYIISLIMNVIPNIKIASFGAVFFTVIFFSTYILKWISDKNDIHHSHYVYLIKTIWIFSLFVIVGVIAAYYLGDHTAVNNLMESAMNGSVPDINSLNSSTYDYMNINKYVFGCIFFPVTIHLLYRLGKGLYLAYKNLPITNTKTWL